MQYTRHASADAVRPVKFFPVLQTSKFRKIHIVVEARLKEIQTEACIRPSETKMKWRSRCLVRGLSEDQPEVIEWSCVTR